MPADALAAVASYGLTAGILLFDVALLVVTVWVSWMIWRMR